MKKYIILLMSVTNTMTFAQSRAVCKNAEEAHNPLSVHVSGSIEGHNINFDHTFDLSMVEKSLRFVLKEKLLDSLDLYLWEEPVRPTVPKGSKPRKRVLLHPDLDEKEDVVPVKALDAAAASPDDSVVQPAFGKSPFTKEIKYSSDDGELFMRYKYVRDGEEYEYERTIKTKGKTEKERLRIIEETERELGLSLIQ